jgi:hypothetical protein
MPAASTDEFMVDDIFSGVHMFIPCGEGGLLAFAEQLEFTVPPPNSPNAGRLLLARTKAGGIKVRILMKKHKVELKIDKASVENELLIRIPIGVRLFRIHGTNRLYYETAEGYDVVPLHFPKGTDPDQTAQELVLAVSPVPPRGAKEATQLPHFKELTVGELNARREQDGLSSFRK